MKKNLILLIFMVTAVFAATNNERVTTKDFILIGNKTSTANKGVMLEKGDGTKALLRANFADGKFEQSFDNGASFSGIGGGGAGTGGENILKNADMESGTAEWTTSGGTLTSETYTNSTDVNKKYLKYIASGVGQSVLQTVTLFPDNISGGCMADMKYLQGDTAFDYEVIEDIAGTPLVLATGSVSDLTSWLKAPTHTFDCPAGGISLTFRIISIAAGTIDFDDAYLGSNKNIAPVGKNPHLVGSIEFGSDCNFARANAAVGIFPDDATCTTTVNGAIETLGATTLGLNVPTLKKGHYVIEMSGYIDYRNSGSVTTIASSAGYFKDGVQAAPYQRLRLGSNVVTSTLAGHIATVRSEFDVSTDETNVELKMVHGGAVIANLIIQQGIMSLYYYPTDSETQEAFTPEQANFAAKGVNVVINGGTGSHISTVFIGAQFASWTIAENTGIAAGIICSDGSVGGTTCSTGTEMSGVSWNQPNAGKVEICSELTNDSTTAGAIRSFRHAIVDPVLPLVPLDVSTVEASNGAGTTPASQRAFARFCSLHDIDSVGVKGVMLQGKSSSGNFNIIGGHGFRITVRPVSHNGSRPETQNMVDTSVGGGLRTESCRVANTGTATLDPSVGMCESWMSSVNRSSLGIVDGVVKTGIFRNNPICVVTGEPTTTNMSNLTLSPTSFKVSSRVGSTAAFLDSNFVITCTGAR